MLVENLLRIWIIVFEYFRGDKLSRTLKKSRPRKFLRPKIVDYDLGRFSFLWGILLIKMKLREYRQEFEETFSK